MVRPERVELPTYKFVACCSIQLSYGRTKGWNYEGIWLYRQPILKKILILLMQSNYLNQFNYAKFNKLRKKLKDLDPNT
jgi:hypothetical protein